MTGITYAAFMVKHCIWKYMKYSEVVKQKTGGNMKLLFMLIMAYVHQPKEAKMKFPNQFRNLKVTIVALLVAALCSCSQGGGGGGSAATAVPPAPTAIEGFDLSGAYRLTGVYCYTSNVSSRTAIALLNAGYTWNVSISGNTMISRDSGGVGGCTSKTTSKVVYNLSSLILSLTDSRATTSNLSSCTFNVSFTATTGTITPTSFSEVVNHNSVLPDLTTFGLRNATTGDLEVLSEIKRVGAPTDLCFLIFTKL